MFFHLYAIYRVKQAQLVLHPPRYFDPLFSTFLLVYLALVFISILFYEPFSFYYVLQPVSTPPTTTPTSISTPAPDAQAL
jgi:hypothetical protein